MVQGTYQTISHKIRKCVAVPKDGYIIKEGTHEAIIDKDTFYRVQDRFNRDTWQPKGVVNQNKNELNSGAIYVGYIKCQDCGRAMQRSGYMDDDNSFYYFVCGAYLQWKQCSRHAIRVNYLNSAVLDAFQQYVSMIMELESLLQVIKDHKCENSIIIRLNKEIKCCEMERDSAVKFQNDLYVDLKNEILTREQYLHFKQEYTDKIRALDERLESLKKELTNSSLENITKPSYFENLKKYANITTLTRDVILEFVDMIYVYNDGGVRVKFHFQDEFKRALQILEGYVDKEKLAKFNFN